MARSYHIEFRPRGPAIHFCGADGNWYEFADGSRLSMASGPGWCKGCGTITHVELPPTIAMLDGRLHELSSRAAASRRTFVNGLPYGRTEEGLRYFAALNEQVDDIHRRLAWRASRSSSPKCLRCGSAEITALSHGKLVPHPDGKATIRAELVGFCDVPLNRWFFTPEGDCLRRETTPQPAPTEIGLANQMMGRQAIARSRKTADIRPAPRVGLLRRIEAWLGRR